MKAIGEEQHLKEKKWRGERKEKRRRQDKEWRRVQAQRNETAHARQQGARDKRGEKKGKDWRMKDNYCRKQFDLSNNVCIQMQAS